MGQDYFVLFRDTAVPTPTDIEYKKRSEQEDVLLSDKAEYVWAYVGTFSGEQAEIVKQRYKSYIDERLRLESGYLAANLGDTPEIGYQSRTYKMTVIPRKPAALDYLAQVSPSLGFFVHVPLHRTVRIYPESTAEKKKFFNALKSWFRQKQYGFTFQLCYNEKPEDFEPHKRHRSFVELISLETLMDIWQRFGYFQHMDLLRRTAGIWVLETLEKSEVHTKRNRYHPEKIKKDFKSLVLDAQNYIPTLTLRQQVALGKCVDIANSIMTADSCGTETIENIYRVLLEKNHQAEKAEREAKLAEYKAKKDEYTAKKAEYETMGVKYEAMKAEYEAMEAEYEAMKAERHPKRETNVNGDSLSPSLMQAASGRGNPKTAIEAYNDSIEWADEPADVRTVGYSEQALEQRAVTMKPLIAAIGELPGKIGNELQDAWAKFNDPPDETELDYARRLRRTTKNTYDQVAALVEERFPDGKYQAGDGENIRKALSPPKKKE
jgi:hypothetical protein